MTDDSTPIANPFAPPRARVEDAPASGGIQEPATRGSRLAAVVVDALPMVVLGIVAAVMVPLLGHRERGLGGGGGLIIALMAIGIVAWLVYNGVLAYRYGQTFGKRAMGIRVVRLDGSRISFGRLLLMRNLVPGLIGAIPVVGSIYGLLDPLWIFGGPRRCIHDFIADSKVVTAASSTDATLYGSRAL